MPKSRSERTVARIIIGLAVLLILFTGVSWYQTIQELEQDLVIVPTSQLR